MITGVLVDANVLRSRTLRDWLFMLKLCSGGMYTVHATEDILAEVIYTWRRDNATLSGGAITQLRGHLTTMIDDLVTDFDVDGTFPGSDDNDGHVHAAAVAAGSDTLLTCDKGWLNLDAKILEELPYEVHHPDSFFVLVDDSSPSTVRSVALDQARYWYKRRGEVDLPARLRSASCTEFAQRVRVHMQTIDCSQITA